MLAALRHPSCVSPALAGLQQSGRLQGTMRRAFALALLTLVAWSPSIAHADEPAPATPPVAAVEKPLPREAIEVRVIGDKADGLQRTPGSGTLVTTTEIRRAAPLAVDEVLRRVPGVVVRQEYGGGSRLDISIRGVEGGRSRRVLVLEDGAPVSLNPYSEPDLYHAPAVEWLRGVEVVKGSGNILFGPQTLAGTVNFLTVLPPEKPTAVADLDVGTYGYWRMMAGYGDAVGGARYVVRALHRIGDGFRGQPFRSTDALGKLAFPTWRDGEAILKLQVRNEQAASDDVGLTRSMWARDPRRTTLSPDSELTLERYAASLTHTQRIQEKTKLTTLVYAYRTSREWRREGYTRFPTPGVAYPRIVGDIGEPQGAIYFEGTNAILDRTYGVFGIEPRLEHRFPTGIISHTVESGGRLLRETADYAQRSGSNTTTYQGSLDYAEAHSGLGVSAYIQDRMAFRQNLLVTPGVRVERFDLERRVLRQNRGQGPVDVDIAGSSGATGVVPGVGIIYGERRLHVFGGFHVGWAPPRFSSAVTARGVPSVTSGDRSINYELGTRAELFRWLRVESTAFLSNFENQVVINTNPGADTSLVDGGRTRLYGLEVASTAKWKKPLRLPFELDMGVRYTFSHATFRDGRAAGNFLPYAPMHVASANLDAEHESGIGGQVAVAFTGSQYTDTANTVPEDVTGRFGEMSARAVVDATAHYFHKRSGVTLRLTVKNALDATYVSARRPEGIFPGGFRQVLVGVGWTWEGNARDP